MFADHRRRAKMRFVGRFTILLLAAWGSCPQTGQCGGDFNCDGQIGIEDFLLMWSVFGL